MRRLEDALPALALHQKAEVLLGHLDRLLGGAGILVADQGDLGQITGVGVLAGHRDVQAALAIMGTARYTSRVF